MADLDEIEELFKYKSFHHQNKMIKELLRASKLLKNPNLSPVARAGAQATVDHILKVGKMPPAFNLEKELAAAKKLKAKNAAIPGGPAHGATESVAPVQPSPQSQLPDIRDRGEVPVPELQYDPEYASHNVSPEMWEQMSPHYRKSTALFHKEVGMGMHPKVQPMNPSTPSAVPEEKGPVVMPSPAERPKMPNNVPHLPPVNTPQFPKVKKSLESVLESIKIIKERLSKSGYGPKGSGAYTPVDNIKRKQSRTGDIAGEGPNTAVRSFSSKPGQLSAKQSAGLEEKKKKKLSGPVKVYSPEEIKALQVKQKLGKT